MVHALYFADSLCRVGAGNACEFACNVRAADVLPVVAMGPWHCRQSRLTWFTLSNLAFAEPCGVWQAEQPSVFTGECSNTYGPFLSAWHLKQTASPAALSFSCLPAVPPSWLCNRCRRPVPPPRDGEPAC